MARTKASLIMIAASAAAAIGFFLIPLAPKIAVAAVECTLGDQWKTTMAEGKVKYRSEQLCVLPTGGRIKTVEVREGQKVQKGQLLFSMDTRQMEKEMAAVKLADFRQKNETNSVFDALSQGTYGLEEQRNVKDKALAVQIQLCQIRADRDGIVGSVFAEENMPVPEKTLIGSVHTEEKCIEAALPLEKEPFRLTKLPVELIGWNGEKWAEASILSVSSPHPDVQTGAAVQTILLSCDDEKIRNMKIGESITAQIVTELERNLPLLPKESLDQNGNVWLIENGCAYPRKVHTEKSGSDMVVGDAKWIGQKFVLNPDTEKLYAGCKIKEIAK